MPRPVEMRAGVNLQEVVTLHHVGARNQTWVLRLGYKQYTLSYLMGLLHSFKIFFYTCV